MIHVLRTTEFNGNIWKYMEVFNIHEAVPEVTRVLTSNPLYALGRIIYADICSVNSVNRPLSQS